MARPPSLRQLVERHVVAPLLARGFTYSGESAMPTFRRARTLQSSTGVQIAEFQSGVKMGSFGTFAVNLGVYSPELTYPPRGVSAHEAHSWNCMAEMHTRLSHLSPPCPRGALVSTVTGEAERQPDNWWSYRGAPAELARVFATVLRLLEDQGEAWFDAMTTKERFQWAIAVRAERVAAIQGAAALERRTTRG